MFPEFTLDSTSRGVTVFITKRYNFVCIHGYCRVMLVISNYNRASICLYVNVFLAPRAPNFRVLIYDPRMKRIAFNFTKYPIHQGYLVVFMVNQQMFAT